MERYGGKRTRFEVVPHSDQYQGSIHECEHGWDIIDWTTNCPAELSGGVSAFFDWGYYDLAVATCQGLNYLEAQEEKRRIDDEMFELERRRDELTRAMFGGFEPDLSWLTIRK